MSIVLKSTLVAISIIAIVVLTSRLKLKAFIALFVVSVLLAFATLPAGTIIATIKEGFGNTMGSIGLLIILGATIGITLDRTGGTISIAKYILSKIGEKKSATAIAITGFITGLPIFCDSGFIILSGLARSLSSKARISMPFMATVLAASLYSVHCLIPPHPGALAAAGMIKVNIGYLIILGILFAVPGAVAAFFWSRRMSQGKNYPPAEMTEYENNAEQHELPSPLLSFMPIGVPLLLITFKSLLTLVDKESHTLISKLLFFAGEPVFALSIGVIFALILIKKGTIESMNSVFGEAIENAGPILIVTAAGGMFGMVIKATGTGEAAGRLLAGSNIGIVVPFLIALVMKTAQGSSTVAIITTASFIAPMIQVLGLDSEWGKLLAMLSMGAGSMIVSHANDSYFWVISNFSGIEPSTTLKVYSSSTIVMGIVVFSCVWITSLIVL